MIDATPSPLSPYNPFTTKLLTLLKRHPKRIVFTEGEDIRVIRVAARLVQEEVIAPILLGNKENIQALAKTENVSLSFIRIIDPTTAKDLPLFCDRFSRIERYKGHPDVDAPAIMRRPLYFGAMMVQYGQADAMVSGNKEGAAAVIRASMRLIKPISTKHKLLGASGIYIPAFERFGNEGILFLADTGFIADPTVEDLAHSAISTGSLALHILGKPIKVALLSASTHSSHNHLAAQRSHAAVALAQSYAIEQNLSDKISFVGEIQIDAALDPEAYAIRCGEDTHASSADVLIFPSLDAADIWTKSLRLLPDVRLYGMFLSGFSVPVVQIPRQVEDDQIFGCALAAGIEAIKSHDLYPDGLSDWDI